MPRPQPCATRARPTWSAGVVPSWSVRSHWVGTAVGQFRVSSSPGGSLPRGPHQIRTWRFPPSGSSADVARGSRATTVRSCGDMIRRRRSAGHGSLRTITPTRAAFARPGPGGYPFPGVIARMQPSDSLIPIGLGSGRPLPSAYPGARATRSNEGLPGVRAVLFQRAVVVDPAGCGALLAHGAGPAVAFRSRPVLVGEEPLGWDRCRSVPSHAPTPSDAFAEGCPHRTDARRVDRLACIAESPDTASWRLGSPTLKRGGPLPYVSPPLW